ERPHLHMLALVIAFLIAPPCPTCPTCPTGVAATQLSDAEATIRAVAALPGEPHAVAAAGVLRDESPILTIENPSAFDPADPKGRGVILGAPGGDPAAVVDLVRWFKTRAPGSVRARWSLSALPLAQFDEADKLSLARWTTFQAPDLIVTVGSLPLQIDAPMESIGVEHAAAALERLLTRPREMSALHRTITERIQRQPLAIARLLARRYPETPAISYIPALAWIGTLRVAALDNDEMLRAKVLEQTRPLTSCDKRLFPPPPQASTGSGRIQLTTVAGTMVFEELAP